MGTLRLCYKYNGTAMPQTSQLQDYNIKLAINGNNDTNIHVFML